MQSFVLGKQYIFKTYDHKWAKPTALLGYIWKQLNSCDIKYTYIYAPAWNLTLLFLLKPGRPRYCLLLTALHGKSRVRVSMCEWISLCVCRLAHLEQRQGFWLSSPPEGRLLRCWGHGRWVAGRTPEVWGPAPGATSLGLQKRKK